MADIDYKALKKGGFMRQVDAGRFALRLRVGRGANTSRATEKGV